MVLTRDGPSRFREKGHRRILSLAARDPVKVGGGRVSLFGVPVQPGKRYPPDRSRPSRRLGLTSREGAVSICAGARRVLKNAIRRRRGAAHLVQLAKPEASVGARVAVSRAPFAAASLARRPLGQRAAAGALAKASVRQAARMGARVFIGPNVAEETASHKAVQNGDFARPGF